MSIASRVRMITDSMTPASCSRSPRTVRKAQTRALPHAELDSGQCLAAQGVVCVICVAKCPERAIAGQPGGRVAVNADKCTGCGACVPACPQAALAIVDRG